MAAAGGGRARPPRARAARTAESRGSTSGRRRRGEDEEREDGHPTYDVGDSEDLAEEDGDAQEEESEDEDEDDDDDNDDDDDEDEDDDGDADADEDDDESPFKFLERLDPNWLTRRSYPQAALSAQPSSAIGVDGRSPAGGADDAEFYAAMIQMLTHVLGSSDSIGWASQATPGSQLAPSPFAHPQSSPAQTPNHAGASHAGPSRSTSLRSKNELSALQPLIQALIARLGKDQQVSRRPVGEQDLTALLQTLMEQQQRQQQQQQHSQRQSSDGQAAQVLPSSNYQFAQPSLATQAASDSALGRSHPQTHHIGVGFGIAAQDAYRPLHFADLDFEDEDEDDPDFNPDLNPDLPLPSAWSLAVRDVVASEKSRAAAAAVAASHSGTPSGSQTPADAARRGSYREGDPHPHAQLFPHPTSFATEAERPPAREPSTHANTSVGEANEGLTTAEHIDTRATAEAVRAASATQSEPEQGEQSIPRKRGRKPVLEPGEAQRRRAQRNVEYQRMRRQVKKAEESEQSEAVLELRAEVKMLRAEMERLRDENAMLRAQRELDRLQRSNRR